MSKNPYWSTIYRITLLISKSKRQPLTDHESAMLKEWLDSDPKNVALYNKLSANQERNKVDDMLSRDPMRHYHKITGQTTQKSKIVRFLKYGVGTVAASLLIALMLPFGPMPHDSPIDAGTMAHHTMDEIILQSPIGSENITVHPDSVYDVAALVDLPTQRSGSVQINEEPVTISTPVGKTIAFTLQDGSTVYLNSKSSITFDNSPNFEKNRAVALDGEAYFVVETNQEHPFVVTNGGKEIKVLGTAFNVRGYEEQDRFKLGLASGKVELSMKDQGYIGVLDPGHEVTYDKTTNKISRETNKNIDNIGAWRKGVYIFEQTSIEDLTRDLQLMYPITFKYEKDLPRYLFSGEISREENWRKVLDKLEMTNRVKFIIEDNEVTVRDVRYAEELTN